MTGELRVVDELFAVLPVPRQRLILHSACAAAADAEQTPLRPLRATGAASLPLAAGLVPGAPRRGDRSTAAA